MDNCPSTSCDLSCHMEADHYGSHLHFAENGTTAWLDELSIPPDYDGAGFTELNLT